jgi:DNA (cytosine-5)-methyltransferase 1
MPVPNHVHSRISALDLEVAIAVPPGGNWKNVPEGIPLARLDTIRQGFAAGNGSRSTYYGRLHPDRPSYTINTHFMRPGNGCHLHYDYDGGQHRTLSSREAARLQSFPDDFIFHGPQTSIAQQIGNAVPPLLAYQLARSIGTKGLFLDLFSGAGGLGLGFAWAGWKPIGASDINANFLRTHAENIKCPTILGDIRDQEVVEKIIDTVEDARSRKPDLPLWILGGPPCQGFSTAGNKRSMADERNHLFRDYASLLTRVKPDGFVFENVMGLLNMEQGEVFSMVKKTLSSCAANLSHSVLHSDRFGVPQRRSRVVLIGHRDGMPAPKTMKELTALPDKKGFYGNLAPAISVFDALSDLPPLRNGENGEELDYLNEPNSDFQLLMRGRITPHAYLMRLGRVPRLQ